MTRLYILSVLMIAVLSMAIWKPTNAYFIDSVMSGSNVFAAASTFPSSQPSITITPSDTITPTTPEATITQIPTTIPSASPTPENIANHIVISEVQTNGTGNTSLDFIELYNPTSNSISLNGFRLVKRNSNPAATDENIFLFTASHSIPAHGYFLWSNSLLATSLSANVSSTDVLATTSNSVGLRQGALNTGTLIDALSWSASPASLSEGSIFPSELSANQSMERKALNTSDATSMTSGSDISKGNGYDSGNNANDFILRTASQPQNSGSGTESL